MDTHRTADLVISIGALHHIPNYSMVDPITKALECAERFAIIGLYHKESRDAMGMRVLKNIDKFSKGLAPPDKVKANSI